MMDIDVTFSRDMEKILAFKDLVLLDALSVEMWKRWSIFLKDLMI